MAKHPGDPTDFESFLTWEALTDILSYDPGTGEFRWIKSSRLGWVGRVAGYIDQSSGYRRIEILNRSFFASRLAWLYITKKWPRGLIDHKNGNRFDDRWDNLRDTNRIQNGQKRRAHKNNKSGILGVYWHSSNDKWAAHYKDGDKTVHLGTFDSLDEAAAARKAAEEQHYGEYRRQEDSLPPYIEAQNVEKPKIQRKPQHGKANDFESFLTQETLIEVLSYDPANGQFYWRSNKTNPKRIKVGSRADSSPEGRYADVWLLGRRFRAHRLAWFYMTGHWPNGDIDHINQNKLDNSWSNLREATRSQNTHNRGKNSNNTSGYKGIYFRKDTGKWRAMAGLNYQQVSIGQFDTKEEALEARRKFDEKHLGEFAVSDIDTRKKGVK